MNLKNESINNKSMEEFTNQENTKNLKNRI